MTKTPTPQDISERLAAVEAEANRLRARAAAIAQAERDARAAAEVHLYREAFNGLSIAANRERSAAKARLDELANAPELDVPALLDAFCELKNCDSRCAAVASYASQLDYADPLPPTPTGVPRSREPRTRAQYADWTWSHYLDGVITKRANQVKAAHLTELRTAAEAKIDAAVKKARSEAAALADGQQLNINQPVPIAELHRQAVQAIDPDTFDKDKVRAAGPLAVQRIAERAALDRLITAEAANPTQ